MCCSTSTTAAAALRRVASNDREHLLDDHRREAQAELVDQHQPRPAGECAGEGEHLLLASGQQRRRGDRRAREAGEVLVRVSVSRRSPGCPRRKCSATVSPKKTLRPSGCGRCRAGPEPIGERGRILPSDVDRPGHRPHDAGDHAQCGGLPGAVGAEQRDDLAGADVQVEVAHHRGPVVTGGQPCDLDERAHSPRLDVLPGRSEPPGAPR